MLDVVRKPLRAFLECGQPSLRLDCTLAEMFDLCLEGGSIANLDDRGDTSGEVDFGRDPKLDHLGLRCSSET